MVLLSIVISLNINVAIDCSVIIILLMEIL